MKKENLKVYKCIGICARNDGPLEHIWVPVSETEIKEKRNELISLKETLKLLEDSSIKKDPDNFFLKRRMKAIKEYKVLINALEKEILKETK